MEKTPTAHKPSKRFSPTWWTERLVPVLLVLLLLALAVPFVLIILSVVGLTPGR